jgi:hypothetical protein
MFNICFRCLLAILEVRCSWITFVFCMENLWHRNTLWFKCTFHLKDTVSFSFCTNLIHRVWLVQVIKILPIEHLLIIQNRMALKSHYGVRQPFHQLLLAYQKGIPLQVFNSVWSFGKLHSIYRVPKKKPLTLKMSISLSLGHTFTVLVVKLSSFSSCMYSVFDW